MPPAALVPTSVLTRADTKRRPVLRRQQLPQHARRQLPAAQTRDAARGVRAAFGVFWAKVDAAKVRKFVKILPARLHSLWGLNAVRA